MAEKERRIGGAKVPARGSGALFSLFDAPLWGGGAGGGAWGWSGLQRVGLRSWFCPARRWKCCAGRLGSLVFMGGRDRFAQRWVGARPTSSGCAVGVERPLAGIGFIIRVAVIKAQYRNPALALVLGGMYFLVVGDGVRGYLRAERLRPCGKRWGGGWSLSARGAARQACGI